MKALAAVVREAGAAFVVEPVELAAPGDFEVLVEIAGTGICQTDLSAWKQDLPFSLPAVLGHEGAGIVRAVGQFVRKVAPGDPVVLTFDSCGECRNCGLGLSSYCAQFRERNVSGRRRDGSSALRDANGGVLAGSFFGQSSFATYSLASERNVVRLPGGLPLEAAGPLGCGVQTGAGAVLNVLRPPEGSSIAVFGAGAVGMSAIMAAKAASCATIIAVDLHEARLREAITFGATHGVDASREDPVAAVRRITGSGAGFSVECTGVPAVLRQAVESLDIPGKCCLTGLAPSGKAFEIEMNQLLRGRTIAGTLEGDSDPDTFIPRLIGLWKEGRFPFDRLVRRYPLDRINDAVADMRASRAIKPVLIANPQLSGATL